MIAIAQDDAGVNATLDDGRRVRARYLVGADGMYSAVREAEAIAFEGAAYGESFMLADVRLAEGDGPAALPEREVVLFFSPAGMLVLAPLAGGVHRIVAPVHEAPERPDAACVQALLRERGPQVSPAAVREALWGSRFRVHHRVAASYRVSRVLLAGDAAHVHSPAGGEGMNLGILDAVALAGALKQALAGNDAALDAYGAQRRPIARSVIADVVTRTATAPRLLCAMRCCRCWRGCRRTGGCWRGGCRGSPTAEATGP